MTLNLDRSAWRRAKFGDVVRQCKESTDPVTDQVARYVAGEHMDSDSLAISRWGSVGDGYLGPAFHRRFRTGQVLYGSRRTYLRKVALADFDGVCANTTFVMESADPTRLLPALLPFVMSTESFHSHSVAESKGSVNPYVNWPDIAKYEFDLPPLDQQRRIASLLWATEELLSTLTSEAGQLSDLLAVQREQLIWGGGYEERPLTDVVASCDYGTSERCVAEAGNSATPVLRIPNVVTGRLDLTNLKHLPSAVHVPDAARTRVGDFLVVRTNGNPAYVGSGALVPRLEGVWLYASYLLRVRVKPELLSPKFLDEGWKAATARRRLAPYIRSSAGNYNLSASSLLSLSYPIPRMERQQEICLELSRTEEAAASVATELDALGVTRQRLIALTLEGAP